MTYTAPLKVTFASGGVGRRRRDRFRSIRDIKEQDVYMGICPSRPAMVPSLSMVRSVSSSVRCIAAPAFSLTMIKVRPIHRVNTFRRAGYPYRGSWLDFEFDAKDIAYAYRSAPQIAGDDAVACLPSAATEAICKSVRKTRPRRIVVTSTECPKKKFDDVL